MSDVVSSFSLTLLSPHHPALLTVFATSFHPLLAWLPWLHWDGCWVESHPMHTTARCPVDRLGDTVAVLQQKGFKQTRVSAAFLSASAPHSQSVQRSQRCCVVAPLCCAVLQNMLMAKF